MDSGKSATEICNNDIKEERTPGCYLKVRVVLAAMCFVGAIIIASIRFNMSLAVVVMVKSTSPESTKSNITCFPTEQTLVANSSNISTQVRKDENAEFEWTSNQQGLLLGSLFYGYIVSNIPGAYLVQRCGIRYVLGIAMFFSCIITLLTPVLAKWSFVCLVVSRIFLGVCQGVTMPSMYCAWGKWAPPAERTFMVSLQMSGLSVGSFITMPLSAFIADLFGWEAVFYATGVFALLWSILWIALIRDSPEEHPRISEQEKQYIVSSIRGQKKIVPESQTSSTPWKEIVTSAPVWAIIASHYAYAYGDYFCLTMLPTYMATVQGFDLLSSGGFSALPFVLQTVTTIIAAYVTDMITERRILTITTVRKINSTLGLTVPAILVVSAGYVGCNSTAAITFLTVAVAASGLNVSGSLANVVDIAPAYSAPIFGISNTIANISGFLAPQITGLILFNGNSISQWQIVFWVTAIIYGIGTVTYLLLASAVEQPWASRGGASEVEVKEPLTDGDFSPVLNT